MCRSVKEILLARREQITARLKTIARTVKRLKDQTADLAIEKIRINQKLNQREEDHAEGEKHLHLNRRKRKAPETESGRRYFKDDPYGFGAKVGDGIYPVAGE